MKLDELKDSLYQAGVVGAGGAGFPTHGKLSDQAQTIILNCAECEPLIKVDRQLITEYSEDILTGMALLVAACDAAEGIIAVKKSYQSAIEAVQAGISRYPKLRLHILPDIYPAGDEVVLIYETTGKIVPQGKIPILTGCVVVNVETVYNLVNKTEEDKPVTEKYVTVAGLVNKPVTLKVPVGVTVKQLIRLAGGLSSEQYTLLMGGPMTGRLCSMQDVVTKTTKALLVLPPDSPAIRKRRCKPAGEIRNAMSACSQCSMCTTLCPRNLLGHSIKPHDFMRAIANGKTEQTEAFVNSMFCCSCGLCEMYSCHQGLSPRRLLDAYKAGLKEKGVGIPDKAGKGAANPMREYQKVPEHRLVARLDLHKFDTAAPLTKIRADEIKEVRILLRQSIGAPCTPLVTKGDQVEAGQQIGQPPQGALGVCLHASITGTVTKVTDTFIDIKVRTNGDGVL